MTFSNRNVSRSISETINNSGLDFGELKVVYATDNIPVDHVQVRNAKNYKNLRLSVAELNRDGKRIKVESVSSNGTVGSTLFISDVAIDSFIQAVELLRDYQLND